MCDKNLGNFAEATEQYNNLKKKFIYDEGCKIVSHTVSFILLPLQSERIKKQNLLENSMQLFSHFHPAQPQNKDHMLKSYINRETGFLNMEKHGQLLVQMLAKKSFFNRFDFETLRQYLKFGEP